MRLNMIPGQLLRHLSIALALFILAFALVYTTRTMRISNPEAIVAPDFTELLVYETMGLDELTDLLGESGILFDEQELRWAAGILGWRRFLPGRYTLEGPEAYDVLFRKLAMGLQTPKLLRVPAGVSKQAIKERIARQMKFEAAELEAAMQAPSFLDRHELQAHQLYGRLLPDTYEVYWTTGPEQLLERLLSEFDARVTRPHAERMQELGLTVDEVTTLASIIEWEARYDHEKPRISGLYWNRLNRRWRLQADPTVNYAKGERGRLIFADYRIDHPYNTYRIFGLPPGPINNPSWASLEAAMYPESHNYMFMVATPQGTHAFSRTYAEHQRKSREWTTWLREQRQIRAQREREEALLREKEQAGIPSESENQTGG